MPNRQTVLLAVTFRPEKDSGDEEAAQDEEEADTESSQIDEPGYGKDLRRNRAKVTNQDRQNGKGAQGV